MFHSLGYEVARSILIEANLPIACECVSFRLAFVGHLPLSLSLSHSWQPLSIYSTLCVLFYGRAYHLRQLRHATRATHPCPLLNAHNAACFRATWKYRCSHGQWSCHGIFNLIARIRFLRFITWKMHEICDTNGYSALTTVSVFSICNQGHVTNILHALNSEQVNYKFTANKQDRIFIRIMRYMDDCSHTHTQSNTTIRIYSGT